MARKRFYDNHWRLKHVRRVLRRQATPAERRLWQMLRRRQLDGLRFRRQYSIGHHVLDFYCPQHRLAVELDGASHDDPARRDHDAEREAFLRTRGVRVLRFENRLVFEQPEVVAEAIRYVLGRDSEGTS
jgi:very-short-patch-repair endonuclease